MNRQRSMQASIPGLLVYNQFAEVCVVCQVNIQNEAGDTVTHLSGRGLGKNNKEIRIGFCVHLSPYYRTEKHQTLDTALGCEAIVNRLYRRTQGCRQRQIVQGFHYSTTPILLFLAASSTCYSAGEPSPGARYSHWDSELRRRL